MSTQGEKMKSTIVRLLKKLRLLIRLVDGKPEFSDRSNLGREQLIFILCWQYL